MFSMEINATDCDYSKWEGYLQASLIDWTPNCITCKKEKKHIYLGVFKVYYWWMIANKFAVNQIFNSLSCCTVCPVDKPGLSIVT